MSIITIEYNSTDGEDLETLKSALDYALKAYRSVAESTLLDRDSAIRRAQRANRLERMILSIMPIGVERWPVQKIVIDQIMKTLQPFTDGEQFVSAEMKVMIDFLNHEAMNQTRRDRNRPTIEYNDDGTYWYVNGEFPTDG